MSTENPLECRRIPVWLLAVFILFLLPMTVSHAATPPEGGAPPDAQTWFEDAVNAAMAAEDETATAEQRHQALLEQAQEQGRVPVIVRLKMAMTPEAALDAAAAQAQRDALASTQRQVLERLSATAHQDAVALGIKRFTLTPAFAIQADALTLMELLDNPDVLDVVEDRLEPPSLAQSVPLIGADSNGTFSGRTGQGQVVAILDTGVDKTHSFLSGKVVSEACYSSNVPAQGVSSLCPGSVTETTAVNSGLDCPTSIDGCGHGTHVAGIAAGKGGNFSGVARDANLIALQVFSRVDGANCTNFGRSSPCVLTFSSDQIKALERVYALRNTFAIASANMSLGGGQNFSTCDSDTRKPVIDSLRAAGIATVIASGNNGFINSMGAPACISSAVSVGSTTKSDVVSSFSNSASFLDLLAPGSDINSSVPGGSFGLKSGTSMAAPHVAGAWAVLKQAKTNAGVDEVLNALKTTGLAVLDARNGITKPRIRVNQALAALVGGGVPGKPTTIAPSGTIATNQPTYSWNAVSGATWYQLYVNDSTGNKIATWYTAAQTNCGGGTGTCSITPAVPLATGAATWWVQGWNTAGNGPWSDPRAFTVSTGGGGFNEQFQGGTASNWIRDSGSWSVVSNEYYFTEGVADRFSTSTYNAQYTDLDYSAQIWRNGDNSAAHALVIRASGAAGTDGGLTNGYFFQITRGGEYSVWKRVNGISTALQGWTVSSAINQGSAWNTLRVVANGSALAFYVNGTRVWQGSDGSLSSGRVGLRMYRDPSSTGNGFWVDWATLNPNPQVTAATGQPAMETGRSVAGDENGTWE